MANLKDLNRQRNQLMAAMEDHGIQVRQGTHAVHTLGYYARKYGLRPEDFPNSLLADRLSITLPLFPGITAEQQERAVGLSQASRKGSYRVRPSGHAGPQPAGGGLAGDLKRMVRALAHRGPDDEGHFIDDNLGLAHRRLAIIDPSPAGHQPMVSPRTDRWP